MKFIKSGVAILILISMLVLSSCDIYYRYSIKNGPHPKDTYFPEGYTGGFGISHGDTDAAYYWVETYEECVEAIELLKSHGSTFITSSIFSYEGDLFDTKYCFDIGRKHSDPIEYGENPFDRWAEEVYITSYAFYDDVTIDELIYSYCSRYNVYIFSSNPELNEIYDENPDVIYSEFIIDSRPDFRSDWIYYDESQPYLFNISYYTDNPIPESGLDAILNSIVVVE